MNKKYTLIGSGILLIILVFVWGLIYLNKNSKNKDITQENIPQTIEEKQQEVELSVQDKIKRIKKKLALKWLIAKGNTNIQEQEYTLALTKYLKISRELSNDPTIIEKLGEIYFGLHKYSQSYRYYSQILDNKKIDIDMAMLSFFFAKNINTDTFDEVKTELSEIQLDPEREFYYNTSLECYNDYNNCKSIFVDQYKNYTGTGEIIPWLTSIHEALKNYDNFQTDDIYYQDALIAGAFFSNNFYSVVIEVWNKILINKPDYLPILKLMAKSSFELWNWKDTKKYLSQINKMDNTDPEVSYFLAIVQEKLHEYLLSIIHFQNALEHNAENSLDIRKRLVYNYFEIDQYPKMLSTLRDMAEENTDDLTIDDFEFIIYHHIDQSDLENAKKYTIQARELFPDSYILDTYFAWLLNNETQIEDSLNQSEELIDKTLTLQPKDPLVLLVKWMTSMRKGEYSPALIYLKKSLSNDKNNQYASITKNQLEVLQELKNKPPQETTITEK